MFKTAALESLPAARPVSSTTAKTHLQTKEPAAEDAYSYWIYCDNCGTKLQNFRCRLVCPTCGFFHSCSEP